MRYVDNTKIVEIFCNIDDFCKIFNPWSAKQTLKLLIFFTTRDTDPLSTIMCIVLPSILR